MGVISDRGLSSHRWLTLDRINEVLATFSHCRLEMSNGRLYVTIDGSVVGSAKVRSDGTWFHHGRMHNLMSGTDEQCVVQVVRWYRDLPRRPRRFWGYARSHGMGNDRTSALLDDYGYFDPRKTCCVLCGGDDPRDWWSLDGATGPCCNLGQCRSGPRSDKSVSS